MLTNIKPNEVLESGVKL